MSILEYCEKTIETWLKQGAEYIECRAENRARLSVRIVDGKVKRLGSGIVSGVGVRVLYRGSLYFASFSASAAARGAVPTFEVVSKPWVEKVSLASIKPVRDSVVISPSKPFDSVSTEEKVKLLVEENKRVQASGVKTVETFYVEETVEKWILTSEGTKVRMVLPYVYLYYRATASEAGKINEGRVRLGGIGGLEILREEKLNEVAKVCIDRTLEGLRAKAVKPGSYRVLLDGEMNHLFAHEAVGHASEGDTARTRSLLKGRLGKRVASPLVDLVDDGRFEVNGVKGFGWIPYDDEGVPTERTFIIRRGVLVSYMTDRATARFFGLKPTGNARAEDFKVPPIVRMRNTFIVASEPSEAMSNEELLEELGSGLLLKGARGGQVDPARGSFTFGVQEVYRVEGGEVRERLASTSISGNFLEVLGRISAVGREFGDPSTSVGFCGKGGQRVPVGSAGVWLLVDRLHVGG